MRIDLSFQKRKFLLFCPPDWLHSHDVQGTTRDAFELLSKLSPDSVATIIKNKDGGLMSKKVALLTELKTIVLQSKQKSNTSRKPHEGTFSLCKLSLDPCFPIDVLNQSFVLTRRVHLEARPLVVRDRIQAKVASSTRPVGKTYYTHANPAYSFMTWPKLCTQK